MVSEATCYGMESNMSKSEPIEIEFYGEICCDMCNEVIHNHMECPECKNDWAATNFYGPVYDYTNDDPCILECEECGAKFQIVEKTYPYSWVKI